jgi:hypothetical protein
MSSSEPAPIFIVGAPRSGTTLLRSIVDAHPNICCPPWETGVFDRFDRMLSGDLEIVIDSEQSYPLHKPELVAWCRRSCDDLFRVLTEKSGKPRWAEKTPAHVFHIDLIHATYPAAQFVHIIRNGRDAVRSLQSQPWAPGNIRWSCHRWVQSVQAGREAGRKLPAAQYLELRYEDLISEPELNIKSLCHFLHEDYAPAMLNFHEPKNNTWGATAKPLTNKPVNKHRELTLWERLNFRVIGGATLKELGYR